LRLERIFGTNEDRNAMNAKVARSDCDYGFIDIRYINIQGLTKEKMAEIEILMNNDDGNKLFILSETQLKCDRVDVDENYRKIVSMRDANDLKGGGLMTIFKKDMDIMKKSLKSNDILKFTLSLNQIDIVIIVVYFSVKSSRNADERNRKIQKIIENEVENMNHPLMIIGDFNGHIEELGKQNEDKNGKMIKSFINDFQLILLNLDNKCSGMITWQRGEFKSVIDYALVNSKLYEMVETMKIGR